MSNKIFYLNQLTKYEIEPKIDHNSTLKNMLYSNQKSKKRS